MMSSGNKIDAFFKENRLDKTKQIIDEKIKYSLSFGDTVINYDLSLN